MKTLKPSESLFWQRYLGTLPVSRRPVDAHVEAAFAGNREITDGLLRLYLEGKKTAGSSLVKDFEVAGDALPKVGNYWIVLDSEERPGCLVKTVRVEFNRFGDIPAAIAEAEGEGEGDLTTAYWKRVHAALYAPFLAGWGINNLDDAQVITEFFEVALR